MYTTNKEQVLCIQAAFVQDGWTGGFLEKVLMKLGFHSLCVQWVMSCVSTVRYSLRFNGVPTVPFAPTRELSLSHTVGRDLGPVERFDHCRWSSSIFPPLTLESVEEIYGGVGPGGKTRPIT